MKLLTEFCVEIFTDQYLTSDIQYTEKEGDYTEKWIFVGQNNVVPIFKLRTDWCTILCVHEYVYILYQNKNGLYESVNV